MENTVRKLSVGLIGLVLLCAPVRLLAATQANAAVAEESEQSTLPTVTSPQDGQLYVLNNGTVGIQIPGNDPEVLVFVVNTTETTKLLQSQGEYFLATDSVTTARPEIQGEKIDLNVELKGDGDEADLHIDGTVSITEDGNDQFTVVAADGNVTFAMMLIIPPILPRPSFPTHTCVANCSGDSCSCDGLCLCFCLPILIPPTTIPVCLGGSLAVVIDL
jgi:hypothetical protein